MAGTHGYTVQILLPLDVDLDPIQLHTRLRTWRDNVELLTGPERLAFVIPTGDLPLLVYIFHAPPDAYADPLCDALTWTPTWHERWDETAARYHASIVVAMTAQRPINHASMLLAFLAVLDTVLFSLEECDRDACVLHWIPAKQLLTFERYRALRMELGPCGPAVNVRIANATGRPGELLADTVGLASLGLPDLQTVFSNRDPAEVALRLRVLVRSMFVGDRLDCAWTEEASLFPPARDTLTLRFD
jgi:hypothetical protein